MADSVNGQRHDRSALILYGSETGNSEDVAEELGNMAERLHFMTRVSEMDLLEINILLKYTLVIFAISTTGQGEFPRNARKFWKSLLRKRLPPDCLGHVSFTTFGLGDSSYPKFNWTARKLHKRLEQLGAKEVYPRGEGDEQHGEGIEGTFLSWKVDLSKHLLSKYPLPEGKSPILPDVPIPPKFFLRRLENDSNASNGQLNPVDYKAEPSASSVVVKSESHMPKTISSPGNIVAEHKDQKPSNNQRSVTAATKSNMGSTTIFARESSSSQDPPSHEAFGEQLKDALPGVMTSLDQNLPPSKNLPIGTEVTLISNKRVTPTDHWQDVRELTFYAKKQLKLGAGSTMTIYPKNFPDDVQTLVDLMGWEKVADWPLEIVERREYPIEGLCYIPSGLRIIPGGSLRDLLTLNLDITSIPKRKFFEKMANYTADELHKERLKEFADPEYTDDYYNYATRPRRSILEVLADFPSVKFPWGDTASIFPVIRGRKFSIASGGVLKNCPYSDYQTVQLLVAIVKYKTVIKKIRQGLCSRYIISLPEQTELNVEFEANSTFCSLENFQVPIIMIGPGTGIAPLRSLIWERAKYAETAIIAQAAQLAQDPESLGILDSEPFTLGEHYLFFGCRNEHADYFYKDEWSLGQLSTTVFPAFSRDQEEKVYVQDLIRREKKLLYKKIFEGAYLYVCGSSGVMPKAVREALVDVMLEDETLNGDREKAAKALDHLESSHQYVQETW